MIISRFVGGLLVLLVLGCAPRALNPQVERGTFYQPQYSGLGAFERLWAERTIVLSSQRPGGTFPLFPGTGTQGQDRGESFPLIVRATLVDSTLIEAGIREFGRLASMTADQLEDFRVSYRSKHDTERFLFVWAEIQTSFSEEYLKLDRWVIFVENEKSHQFDPIRLVPHPMNRPGPGIAAIRGGDAPNVPPEGPSWVPVTRNLELYFPLSRASGEPLLAPAGGTLKFVVVQANKSHVRAEGTWDFPLSGRR